MTPLRRRTILWLLVSLTVFGLTVLVVSTVALAGLVGRVSDPRLGLVLGWGLVALYAATAVHLVVLFRIPPLIPPPPASRGAARYPERLAARFRANPRLAGVPTATPAELAAAVATLDAEAAEAVDAHARAVFASTAVAHSGSLETLLVLGSHVRMANQLATHYWGSMSVREHLAFWRFLLEGGGLFFDIEELEIVEEARPVLGSIVGAALGGVRGLQVLSQLAVDALMRGGSNTAQSLRIGRAVMLWCTAQTRPDSKAVTAEAAAWARPRLGTVIRGGATIIVGRITAEAKGIVGRGTDKVGQVARSPWKSGGGDPTRGYRT